MWSGGCIVAEMVSAVPVFPGQSSTDQLAVIMKVGMVDLFPLCQFAVYFMTFVVKVSPY